MTFQTHSRSNLTVLPIYEFALVSAEIHVYALSSRDCALGSPICMLVFNSSRCTKATPFYDLQNMSYLELDLSRPLKVKSEGAANTPVSLHISLPVTYDLILHISRMHGLGTLSDLELDLSREILSKLIM